MDRMLTVVDSMPFDPNQELIGTSRHHFVTMGDLVQSVTEAYDDKRWLTARECLAMLLNPHRFMWKMGPFDDRPFYRDCFFFIIPVQLLAPIGERSGANMDREEWLDYAEVPQVMRKDHIVGFIKNPRNMRRELDSEEVVIHRYEVKGKTRCRRRMLLPPDFDVRVGGEIPRPQPELMVIQYQLCPLTSPPSAREENAKEEDNWFDLCVKEGIRAPQPGPARPPGVGLPPPPDANDGDDGGDGDYISAVPLAWAMPCDGDAISAVPLAWAMPW